MKRNALRVGQDYGCTNSSDWRQFPYATDKVTLIDLGPFRERQGWSARPGPVEVAGKTITEYVVRDPRGQHVAVRKHDGRIDFVHPREIKAEWPEYEAAIKAADERRAVERETRRATHALAAEAEAEVARLGLGSKVAIDSYKGTAMMQLASFLDLLRRMPDATAEADK